MVNCLLTGVGGQGTVLASKIISQTAMDMGEKVRTAETIGMAQRGGSVVSHVRIGNSFSPLIPNKSADIIIAFEPAEAVRALPYLKKGGSLVVSNKAVQPVTASLAGKGYDVAEMIEYLKNNIENLTIIDVDHVIEVCKNPKVLNVALIGAAIKSPILNMSSEIIESTIRKIVPEKFVELNLKALKLGMGEML